MQQAATYNFCVEEDVTVVACLRLEQAPESLLDASNYEISKCDYCQSPIVIAEHALLLVNSGEVAAKACTACIGPRIQHLTKTITRDRMSRRLHL